MILCVILIIFKVLVLCIILLGSQIVCALRNLLAHADECLFFQIDIHSYLPYCTSMAISTGTVSIHSQALGPNFRALVRDHVNCLEVATSGRRAKLKWPGASGAFVECGGSFSLSGELIRSSSNCLEVWRARRHVSKLEPSGVDSNPTIRFKSIQLCPYSVVN